MESYKLLLLVHTLSVVVGLGVTFGLPFLQGAAERDGVVATRFMLAVCRRLVMFLVFPALALILLSGAALIFDDATGYDDDLPGWLMAAITWFFVAAALVYVQWLQLARGVEALEGVPGGPLPASYAAISKRMQATSGLLGLSVIGIAFLMVWKPGQ